MLARFRATVGRNRRDIVMLLVLVIIGIAIFLPMMTRWQVMGDYTTHNGLALDAVTNLGEFLRNTPHVLYHLSVAAMYQLRGDGDINVAAAWVMTLCFIATLLIIYWQLRQRTEFQPAMGLILISGGLAIALSTMMPINFFTPENLYFGYFAAHVYHNPTMIIMKPFAIAIFFMTIPLFLNSNPVSRMWIVPIALVTGLSLFAKPSFIISYVPTLGLVTFFLMLRRLGDIGEILHRPQTIVQAVAFSDVEKAKELPVMLRPTYINWPVLIAGLVLPAFAVLYYQTLTWTSSGGIGIDPFRVLFEWTLHYEDNANQQLLFKFLMSVAFPLVVYVLHIAKTYKNFILNVAWLHMIVASIYYYLFVDYTVIAAGDFTWSSQIAVLLLYIVSTIFMLQEYGILVTGEPVPATRWGILLVCMVVFALHIVAGIHWYRMHMSQYMEELIYIWW